VSGTRVAETILASVRMRARQQAGHMDASDLIKSLQRQPCEEGAVHIWGPDADRRPKLLMFRAAKGQSRALTHFWCSFLRAGGAALSVIQRIGGITEDVP
jgi:hypothetical protein